MPDKKDKKDFYQVVIYNLKSETQVAAVDLFLSKKNLCFHAVYFTTTMAETSGYS
jgi:hypothetical protein